MKDKRIIKAAGILITFFLTGMMNTVLAEDMAAEQKARAVYENLIDLADDPDVIDPLRWLREREVVHFQRFGEALRMITE
jgi:Mn-containing catalase